MWHYCRIEKSDHGAQSDQCNSRINHLGDNHVTHLVHYLSIHSTDNRTEKMIFNPDLLTGPHAERVADLIVNDPLFQKLPTQLFTFDNGKTPKGEKQGYLTAIMYLAPAGLSGYLMCAFAHLADCEGPCLNTAGRGKFDNVQKARIRKTLMFHQFPNEFNALLISEMDRAQRKADRMDLTLVVRLNGTSDVAWENQNIVGNWTIFELFPDVQFYDYTKAPTRHKLPDNYHLTFSYSGVDSFKPIVKKWRDKRTDQNMAVVFESEQAKYQTKFYNVVNGDESDLRFLDKRNNVAGYNNQFVVVGLTAKGNAKNDVTGFVVRPTA